MILLYCILVESFFFLSAHTYIYICHCYQIGQLIAFVCAQTMGHSNFNCCHIFATALS